MGAFGMGTGAEEGIGHPKTIMIIGSRKLRGIGSEIGSTELRSVPKAGEFTQPGNAKFRALGLKAS